MKNDKIKIKITLSGKRACGKSVMAVYLYDLFTAAGADVKLTGYDWEHLPNTRMIKDRQEYIRIMPKKFSKLDITIYEKVSKSRSGNSVEQAIKTLEKWKK